MRYTQRLVCCMETDIKIIAFFDKVITQIDKQGVYNVQQYCTLPQILHYVVAAFETDGEEVVI